MIPRIHFAGCGYEDQCDLSVTNWIKGTKHSANVYYNLPPVTFNISEQGYHLKLDLFNNNFVRRGLSTTITTPSIYVYPGSLKEEDTYRSCVFNEVSDEWLKKQSNSNLNASRGNLNDRTSKGRAQGRGGVA